MKLPIIVAAFLAMTGPATSQMLVNQPDEILAIVRSFGDAQTQTTPSGRPMLTGTIDGADYGILMYGCESNTGCASLQFFATFTSQTADLLVLNTWNQDQRFGAAYLSDRGNFILHWSVNIDYGVSRQNFIDSVDIWRQTLAEFVIVMTP